MKLTDPQLRTVRYYLKHRDHAPTWAGFFRRFARTLFLWTITGVVGSYVCVVMGLPMLAFLLVGMLVGAALRELRQHHHVSQSWPAVAAIVDWKRAQELEAAGS
jgi:hypothetical protein